VKLAHKVWLSSHPARTAEWLADRVRDGFEVHHIDGDGENNAPENLVLIERADHQMLHSNRMLGRPSRVGIRLTKKRLARIMRQYEAAKRESWS
jgi:hypothetical protein